MRLYYAQFPFEVNYETGSSSLYYPSFKALKKDVAEIVQGVVNDGKYLRYHAKPLAAPVDDLVPIEIRVKVERIDAVKLTRGLFCSAVNNAGDAGFVRERVEMRPLVFRFKVPAELLENE